MFAAARYRRGRHDLRRQPRRCGVKLPYAIGVDGKVRWRVAAADKIATAPGIATSNTILVGAEDEHLYAVGPDGASLRRLLAFAEDVDTTPAIARDGTIYVTGDDAQLHAFR